MIMRFFTPTIVFLCIFAAMSGCKKKDTETPVHSDLITGKWQWMYSYHGGAPGPDNPQTVANTRRNEWIYFNTDSTWFQTVNAVMVDSGTFKIDHGTYLPYVGAHLFEYDSVAYYGPAGTLLGTDYFSVHGDTLSFLPYYSGRFSSYSVPSGSKHWRRR